ncbi:PAAR domain-containing protein [Caldimonas sp.]
MRIDGKPAARHGDKCACGATLIASQSFSTTA